MEAEKDTDQENSDTSRVDQPTIGSKQLPYLQKPNPQLQVVTGVLVPVISSYDLDPLSYISVCGPILCQECFVDSFASCLAHCLPLITLNTAETEVLKISRAKWRYYACPRMLCFAPYMCLSPLVVGRITRLGALAYSLRMTTGKERRVCKQ